MRKIHYGDLLLDQTQDLIWAVDCNLTLVYANKSYLNLMKEVTGVEKELNTPVLVEGFGEGYLEKWKSYYMRALSGEYFEIEEHFYNPDTKELQYGHIAFSPIRDEPDEILAVACRSTDITSVIRQKDHASQLMDASLDVFCTIDEAGNFVFVSAASLDHWGYHPQELIGKPYRDLIVEEDFEKTDLVAAEIMAGREFKSFSNRFRKKNGDIAHNLWSARWGYKSKLMYCVARDEKEKIEEEAEKELLNQIRISFNNEEELIPAANRLCENLYAFGKFDLIELWCPNMEQTQIKLMGRSIQSQDFYKLEPSEASFQKNEGLQGKVWEKGKQLLWDEKQINKHFIRKKAASHLGLKAVLGIPLFFNDELVGVLLIGTKRDPDYLEQHSSVLSRLEKFIGSEINRKRLENNFNNVFDAIPEILCITDFEGRFLKINNAGCALLGCATDEVLFHSIDEFTLNEDKGIFEQKIRDLTKETLDFTFENRFLSKNGRVIWLSWNCNPVLEEGLVYASAKNITAEVQLRELNAQAGSLAKIGSWEVNIDKGTLYWSEIVHEIHETDPGSFVPDLATAIDFYREDFRPMVAKTIEEAIAIGSTVEFDAVIVTKNLNERWVRSIGKAEQVDGVTKRFMGSFQDITDRKESEIRLQAFADNLPGVAFQYFIYPDGTEDLNYVTDGAQKVWGFDADGVMNDNNLVWKQIELGGELDVVKKSIMKSVETRSDWKAQWRYITPGNELRIHAGYGSPNFLPDGTVLFNSLILDVTQEYRSEELLEQASAMAKIGSWELNLLDQENDSMYWSPMTREILEVDERYDPSFAHSFALYEPESKVLIQKAIEQLIESGTPFDQELMIHISKGNSKWIRCIGKAEIIDEKCARIFGSFQDIHDRKTAEIQLKTLTDNLPGVVVFQYLLFPDGTDGLRSVSKGSYQLWGYSPEEVEQDINLVWNQTKSGGEFEKVKKAITESVRTKSKWLSRYKSVLPNGDVRKLLGSGLPNFLADGTVLFNSYVLDITNEAKNKELLSNASQTARIGSWEVNFVNNKILWSDITHQLHETDPNSFIPELEKNIDFFREDFQDKVRTSIQTSMEDGTPFDFEAVLVTAKNNQRWVRAIGRPEIIDGQCKRIHGSFQDIHAAKSNELRLKEILGSISDAFYAIDADWNFTYFNKEAENLLKKSADEVLGGNIWEIFPPAKGTSLEEVYRRVASTGKSENFEYNYPGDGCWYALTVYSSSGGVSSYFKNINERKKAAQEIAKANKEKNEILESIGDAFFAVDDEWKVTYWNKQAETILGKVKNDIVGKNLWEEYPDAIDTDFYRQYHRAMESGEIVNFEEYYPTMDTWLEVTVYPSENGLSVYFKDITLRKTADIRLLEANERFELVTKATNDAIWDWDIESDDVYRSNNIRKIFGSKASTKLKKSQFWQDAFHTEDLNKLKESIDKALKDPQSERWEMEYRVLNGDNEELSIIDKGIIVRNKKGQATRMVGAMTDLTRQKKLEKELFQLNESLKNYTKELERSNEELEQFAFITSHDLQEPLRMISGFMNQLKRKYSDQLDDKALQYIHFATDGAKRMKLIILDLLLYSRANKPSEELEEVNLNEVATEYTQLRRKLIAEKNAAITFDALPVLETSRAPITQIIHCLLDNALRYGKEDVTPRIEIRAKEKETVWEFAVKDNGIGIDQRFFDKIFIIFQRLHNREQHDGTGIGLSIAKRSVEFLGGEIWLESTVGEGTTFYFTIAKTNNHIK